MSDDQHIYTRINPQVPAPKEQKAICPFTGKFSTTKEILEHISANKGTDKEHPYDEMCLTTCKKFPHCQREIIEFFEHEKIVNIEIQKSGSLENYTSLRSVKWRQFWTGIAKLELEKHNDEVKKKRDAKNARRYSNRYSKGKGFNGPTYLLKP